MSIHRDCVWNCGGTDCPAPTGNFYFDRRKDAIKKIQRQPFFDIPAFRLVKMREILIGVKAKFVNF